MTYNYEEILLIKTAWYYYIENLTQQKVSELLGISRMRVIRLLEKARTTGVIQFNIRKDSTRRMESEKALADRYQLKDAFIVPNAAETSQEAMNANIARAAAIYINDRLEDNRFINIGYGDTPSRVLNVLATMAEEPISCISLTGGVNNYLPNMQSNVFNARLYRIPAPLIVSAREMVEAIRQEYSLEEIYRMLTPSAFSVIGIGGLNADATIFKGGILNNNEMLLLKRQGAVGDVLSHFLDARGELVDTGIEEKLLSTPLPTLKKLQNVIGVAAGAAKAEAIRAALLGEYLDVLITDEDTAEALLTLTD
ncbi:MAG: sugar-binding transcriptional regulator [Planctomycetes bacterium]|nr:sugar-binding transcriptional regulator [Planctomycetota bacterium]